MFQYPEGFWPDSDLRMCLQDTTSRAMFQYPEGFWPDSDPDEIVPEYYDYFGLWFQYPEGFWPDSDNPAQAE